MNAGGLCMDSDKKNYIIEEAEAIIAECEKKIEKNSKDIIILKNDKKNFHKYKRLKCFTSIIILVETVLCIFLMTK